MHLNENTNGNNQNYRDIKDLNRSNIKNFLSHFVKDVEQKLKNQEDRINR